jgi:hypothetical protein
VKRTPAILRSEPKAPPRTAAADPLRSRIDELATLHLPTRQHRPRADSPPPVARASAPVASPYLDGQLDTLRRMYDGMKAASYRDNFQYLTARSLHVIASRRTSDFGDTRLFKPAEMQQALFARGR